jgi:hypothetical protein
MPPKVLPPVAPSMPEANTWPLGAQSVLAARAGLEGPVTYVPVPTVTVPQPNHPPMPPPPMMPEAPQLNANVNAFSQPVPPKGVQMLPPQGMMPAQAMMPNGYPMYGYPPNAMNPYGPNPYAMTPYAMNPYVANPMMARNPYGQPTMASTGPTANYGRQYAGPLPPQNPFAPQPTPALYANPPMMPPPQQAIQQTGYQAPAPSAVAQQVDQLIRVMRENAYPAQREWAAQMLASYEWRVHPQIVPALVQSAAQDPAGSVRAGCINCLGRMQAAVEPVFATLQAMRSDIDPRVRSEVEQAFVRLGQTPIAPQ